MDEVKYLISPQGPSGYCRCGVICEDDQRTLWYINGPLELIQLEKVLEPATHPPTRLLRRRFSALRQVKAERRISLYRMAGQSLTEKIDLEGSPTPVQP